MDGSPCSVIPKTTCRFHAGNGRGIAVSQSKNVYLSYIDFCCTWPELKIHTYIVTFELISISLELCFMSGSTHRYSLQRYKENYNNNDIIKKNGDSFQPTTNITSWSIFKIYMNIPNILVYLVPLKFYCQSLLLVLHSCLVSLWFSPWWILELSL